jgi:hypothetical protein
VVWEPVLATDLGAPSTATLHRLHDLRAEQFWDKDRLLSHALGEKDRKTVVWDHIAIYEPGKTWQDSPPAPLFAGGTVVRVIDQAREQLKRLLPAKQ